MSQKLINTTAYNFIDNELKKANDINILYNSLILNVVLFLVFFISILLFLYYRYQNKKKNHHLYEQENRNALLEKMIHLEKINNDDDLVTNLPIFYSTL
tara:strand:+ start:444 stop:740 length:297 start_codon:yes stop_codon:yes gene_type:complete